MSENPEIQTLFRFVTIRNPKKILSNRPSDKIALDRNPQSNFHAQLYELAQSGWDAPMMRQQLMERTNQFAQSGQLLSNARQLESLLPDPRCILFADWLAANAAQLTKELVWEQLGKLNFEFDKQQLWDNVLYYSILGRANATLQSILLLLKAQHFLQHWQNTGDFPDDSSLQKLATTEVVLPEGVFPFPMRTSKEATEDSQKEVASKEEAMDFKKGLAPNNPIGVEAASLEDDYDGFYPMDGNARIRPLGIADFRRVEQKLCCYKPGEVAHIENILQGEYKERSTRRLRRSENTLTQSTEKSSETERETSTADSYEMQTEAAEYLQSMYARSC